MKHLALTNHTNLAKQLHFTFMNYITLHLAVHVSSDTVIFLYIVITYPLPSYMLVTLSLLATVIAIPFIVISIP